MLLLRPYHKRAEADIHLDHSHREGTACRNSGGVRIPHFSHVRRRLQFDEIHSWSLLPSTEPRESSLVLTVNLELMK